MAAKKTTKKSVKKNSTAAKKTTKKVEKAAKQPKKEETITIKTNYLYAAIIVVGLVVIGILISKSNIFAGQSSIEGITIVNDENCINCRTEQVKAALQGLFPNREIKEIDVSSSEGQELLKTGVPALPAYFFTKEIVNDPGYSEITGQFSEAFIETKDSYYLHPGIISPGRLLTDINVGDSYVLGDENAPVTIIEFSDFECPYCGRFYEQTYTQLKEKYIDTGKAKLVFKHFPLPFHTQGIPAAVAAECAGEQGKFWEYHDKVFENQDSLNSENYKSWAAELGLDTTQFNECYDSNKYESKVSSDLEQGQNAYIGGTPSFVIDGQIIVGAQPITAFDELLN